jgi:hypothetical protein
LLEFPIICEALFRVALRLYLSNSLAVTDSGKCRYLHDCARATDSAAPSKRQWAGRLRAAIAMGLGMLRHGDLLSGLKIWRTGPSEICDSLSRAQKHIGRLLADEAARTLKLGPDRRSHILIAGLLPLEPQSEFTSQLTLGGCAAAGLTMHKWVAGWHTPEVQSEFTLHLAPTLPGACPSAVLLPVVTAPITQTPEMTS